jgi:hypothetical protein
MKKTYTVTVTYTGEIEAEDKDELEEKLWVVHSIFGEPFDKFLFDAEEVQIELEE